MTYFIFAGDMLVMLFMVCLVVWVFIYSPDEEIDKISRIPFSGEELDDQLDKQSDGQEQNHG